MTVVERKASPLTRPTRARTGARSSRDEAGHAHIAQIQRARILTAMLEVACEHGAANISVTDVVERSGVSRRTFYALFEDREACFLAAFEDALSQAADRVLAAYDSGGKWQERVRAGLVALLSFMDEQPTVGRLLVWESLTAGPRALAWRGEILTRLARSIDEGRSEADGGVAPPALTAEGLVGGVLSLIHTRLIRDEQVPLLELANPLMSMIVLPYLGPAAARRELTRPLPAPVPVHRARQTGFSVDPFKEAGMRITYRTVRVLTVIAELGERGGGSSNRVVGERAGISDQGQVSKLLGRLQRAGLIHNTGLGPGLGAPNEWLLTGKGRELAEGIRLRTGDSGVNRREQSQVFTIGRGGV